MFRRKIDEFELGELIATGSAGKIFDATEKETGRQVAIKVLPPDVSNDRNIFARFKREMLILSKLDHPNIIQYFGGGFADDSLFYAMEKVEGGTLRQFVSRHGRMTWQETVRYGIRLCSALQYIHNHGVVHRDIKPSNVFMTYAGEIKLGDFGIAYDSGETNLTATGLIVGSYAYMSPEQIRGKEIVDSRADLYSLGCVLYEMTCGHPPFEGSTFAQIFDQHLNLDAPPVSSVSPDVPESLEKLIHHLLEKDRLSRPLNARVAQGVLSELKLSWTEDELQYQNELSRLRLAFDRGIVAGNHLETDTSRLMIVSIAAIALLATIGGILFWFQD